MAIAKDEIEKYIFDPKNPKQCDSYKLLLSIAKKGNSSFLSTKFLQYFFQKQIITNQFNNDIWDKPSNYNSMSYLEKIELYKEQQSIEDLKEITNLIKPEQHKLFQYPFINKILVHITDKIKYTEMIEKDVLAEEITSESSMGNKMLTSFLDKKNPSVIKKYKQKKEKIEKEKKEYNFSSITVDSYLKIDANDFYNNRKYNNFYDDIIYDNKEFFKSPPLNKLNQNFILFSNSDSDLDILELNITKSAILITEEKNIDTFLRKNKNSRIKPIFLKKIEDVEILLNVLQKDIQQEKYASIEKDEIATIDSIKVENFFSIESIKLSKLKDKKEIYIVGENGDGKTLLLQSIAIGLAGVKEGDIFNLVKSQDTSNIEILDSSKIVHTKNDSIYEYIYAYGASRYGNCQIKEDKTGYLTLFENKYDLKSPIDWLLALDYNEKADKKNIVSVEEAKKILNKLLNSDIQIDIIPPKQVTFSEKGIEVAFEQLSAGYKGVITIICDLIDRLYEKQPYIEDIKDFKGVVLIDEVELHLHPKWKYNFMKKLRDTFPLIQFIVTTHSPTVILGAGKKAVFYKIYKDDTGKVTISNQIANEGYTNNSLVSSPLFDMETITSREYDKAVSSDDYIYEKIHQQVAKKIEENIDVDETDLLKLIDKELDKI